jgi:hypothetical protein
MSESLFFVSLPKSGTDFTWNTLAEITDLRIPECITDPNTMNTMMTGKDDEMDFSWSTGDFTSQRLIKQSLAQYLPNDFVFGTHMPASYHNIKVLEDAGINKVTVLLRDPRDVVVSWTYHTNKAGLAHKDHISKFYHLPDEYYDWPIDQQISFQVRTFLPSAVNWIEGWVACFSTFNRKIDILFVFFDDLKNNPNEFFKKITDFHDCQQVDLSKIQKPIWGTRHFRVGEHGQWKKEFSKNDMLFSDLLIEDRLEKAFKKTALDHTDFLMCKNFF